MDLLKNDYVHYLLLIVGTFIVVTLASYILNKSLDLLIKRKSEQLHIDPTNFIFLKNSSSFILYAIGLFWIFQKIPYFKALGTAMFAGAGVLAAVIGFASQKAFSNIVGGLFILIFKPFRVGDIIEISNSRKGVVEEITLRHTIIKDYQSQRIVIPNSQISEETIINSSITDDKIRKHIDFGISYDSNIDDAMDIIRKEIKKHPLFIDNRSEKEVMMNQPDLMIRVISLGEYAVTLRASVWTLNFDHAFTLQCDVLKSIKESFDENGIEIPYPYRIIINKNDKAPIESQKGEER